MLNKRFWEHRYEHEQTGWDLGAVSPPLKAFIDHLSNKEVAILIPGCGNGYEAEYLLASGFSNVTVLDIAEMPLQNLQKRLSDPEGLQLVCTDFFEHKGQYDLILEQTFFCALDPARRTDYVQQMHSLLKPGGHLAGVLFNVEFEKEGPPFGGEEMEYRKIFKPFFKMLKMDICENSVQPRMNTELFFVAEARIMP
jgi:SAM-dependent methyltransferase